MHRVPPVANLCQLKPPPTPVVIDVDVEFLNLIY